MSPVWQNWAGEQRCAPARIERPASREALQEAVKRAAADGQTVRAAGSGHSFTDVACTDGVMLDLSGLGRILDVDRSSGLVKIEGGANLHELGPALHDRDLGFENLGDIDKQTLAGAIATATHGTGARLQNLSAQVEAMELVTGKGELLEIDSDDADTLRAARVGLGALGIVASVTVRCVPAFTLRRVDQPMPLEECLDNLDDLADGSDHFEFYTFPHTQTALIRQSERTDDPPDPADPRKAFIQEVVLENYVMDALARVGRRFPKTIPTLLRALNTQVGRSTKVDRSYRVFASQRRVRFTEMEYCVPRENAAEAVRRVLELIDRRRIDVSFPIEVRFVGRDDAYLSPSYNRDAAYIAVHMYRGMTWEPYFRGVEAIMHDYAGRPHWGKRHFQLAETLKSRYPKWRAFQKARARLDPEGLFRNEYTDRVLGPIAG